jgi:hypothetical protein
MAAKTGMNRYIVYVYLARQEPEKYVADDFSVDLGQD